MTSSGTKSPSSVAAARPRPATLRALGREEPPPRIEVAGEAYRLDRVLKHDSWAATSIYENERSGAQIICKLNRKQRALLIPMGWLGRKLARNEEGMLRRLADSPHVPRWTGPVTLNGGSVANGVAHDFVPGHPLRKHERVNDDFFASLRELLALMHKRGLAYVDLHKRENILVGDDGRPYLIDFQISFALPSRWPGNSFPIRWALRILQRSDDYHLMKHFSASRPDLCGLSGEQVRANRPWWIRVHRAVAQPLRALRRKLLVSLRVRQGRGRAESEHFAEEAVRLDMPSPHAAGSAQIIIDPAHDSVSSPRFANDRDHHRDRDRDRSQSAAKGSLAETADADSSTEN